MILKVIFLLVQDSIHLIQEARIQQIFLIFEILYKIAPIISIKSERQNNEFDMHQSDLFKFDKERNQFNLSPIEQDLIYAVSPAIYLTAIFNIVFFLRGKNRTEPPADILLFICFFGILRISSYLISAIYDQAQPPSMDAQVPGSFKDVCAATGFINVLCQIAGFVYNVVFCIYYVIKIRNPFESWIRQNRELHIVCLVIIFVSTLILFLTDLIGISILGVCGYRIGAGIIFLDFALTLCYFVVMVVSSIFFVKYLRSISKFDKDNKMYFKFYFKYLIIASIVHLIGLLALVVVTVNCLLDNSDNVFQAFTMICNLSRLFSPVMVFIVMINHPEAKFSSVLQFANRFVLKSKKKYIQEQDSPFYEDLMTTKRNSVLIQLDSLSKKHLEEADYLSKIKDKNKACLINTILGCISLQQNQYLQSLESRKTTLAFQRKSLHFEDLRNSKYDFQDDEQIFGWNYSEKYEFQLTEQLVLAYQSIFNKKLPTISLKFIAFSSSIFKKLQKTQGINDLYKKMLPTRNQRNILQNVQTDGGRSGQFFFFNYDNMFIIKTISSNELKVLLERIQPYFKYFQTNPDSLIVKILGLYKVINLQTQEQISFTLMGNIIKKIPKHCVLKSYDMKGSTHQRQVLKDQELNQQGGVETRKTLKDMDFHVLQGRIHISIEDSQNLKQIIQQDTSFLYSQGLIDYSLIVLKLDYEKTVKQIDINTSGVKMYKSTKQEGVVYVFGIIDYLQTWNIRKKGEKWYKSIFSKIEGISSQDPRFYSERFMKNLIMLILP